MRKEAHSPVFRLILTDLILLNLINIFFVTVIKGYRLTSGTFGERYIYYLIIINFLWIFINFILTRYRMNVKGSYFFELKKVVLNLLLFTASISIIAFSFKEMRLSRIVIYGSTAVFFMVLTISHVIILKCLKSFRRKKRKNNILIVGNDITAFDLARAFSMDSIKTVETIVYYDGDAGVDNTIDEEQKRNGNRVIQGRLANAKDVFSQFSIHELYIVLPSSYDKVIKELVEIAQYHGARVRLVPLFYKLVGQNFKAELLSGIPIIDIDETPLDNYYNALYKRTFDLIFSLFSLLLISPLLMVIALLVKITSRGSVLYVPERVGIAGRVFKMYKFRTMFDSVGGNDVESTKKNDWRVTKLGGFLRKYNLDELPQFVNVLKGDMSVVGPRPHRVFLDKVMQDSVDRYMLRHYIKPGITGWAQVNGWRGPTLTEEQKIQRTRHDLWYIKHWTFMLDIKIIFKTIFGKQARKNAF